MKKNILGSLGLLSLGILFGGIIEVKAVEGDFDFDSCVKQDECVLESDVVVDSTITMENDLILDLNGHKITSEQKVMATEFSLTIKDSKGGGLVEVSKDYAFYALNGGTLKLESGEIKSLYAPFTGNNTTGDMNFIINGGTLSAVSGPAIYMPGQVTLEINGGTLNGGINLRMGQVTINGGTIINNNPTNVDTIEDYYGYEGNVWLSDAVGIMAGTYTSENVEYGNSLNLVINGGTFESEVGNALTIYALGKVKQDINVTINGGTFNGKEISVAVETPDTLNLEDNSNGKVEDYTQVKNNTNINITNGMFNSNVEKLVKDGYKVIDNNGVYTVEPNLVISADDESVTMESEKPLPNDYKLVVEEKELEDNGEVVSDTQNLIVESIKDYNIKFDDINVLATYDINVYKGSEVVKIDGTDKYKISIAVDENLLNKYEYVKVIYINDDGKVESVYDTNVENGIVSFETTHLSTYSVVGYNAELTSAVVENPSTNDNVGLFMILGAISVIGLTVATVTLKKKHN